MIYVNSNINCRGPVFLRHSVLGCSGLAVVECRIRNGDIAGLLFTLCNASNFVQVANCAQANSGSYPLYRTGNE